MAILRRSTESFGKVYELMSLYFGIPLLLSFSLEPTASRLGDNHWGSDLHYSSIFNYGVIYKLAYHISRTWFGALFEERRSEACP